VGRGRRPFAVLLAGLVFIPVSAVPAQGFAPGGQEPSVQALERDAANGSTPAMVELAERYFHGWGIARSHVAANRWYQRAARREAPGGYFGLGRAALLGYGVPRDGERALEWLRRLAESGPHALDEETFGVFCLPHSRALALRLLRGFVLFDRNPPGSSGQIEALRSLFPC